jgi:bifunctional DNA-binding transcriptional regulator/antitoxin component of YhaV-PrlF toxin-antitoxin module
MAQNILEYKAEDIFKDIPGNDKEVNMIIPPEIMEKQGWKVGDVLKFEIGDKGTMIITKPEEASLEDQGVIVITNAEE